MKKHLEGGTLRTIFPRGSSREIDAFISGDSGDGGEWLLLYSYSRIRNTDPQLKPGVLPTAMYGNDGGSHAHVCELGGFEKADIAEVRFFACTSGHGSVVHFKTSNPTVRSIAWDGNQNANRPEDWNKGFTKLEGHTSKLPGSASSSFRTRNGGFWNFPFYRAGAHHWSIKGVGMENQGRAGGKYDAGGWNVGDSIGNSRGGTRWEVDDGPKGGPGTQHDTVHLVWVRMVPGAYAYTSSTPLPVVTTSEMQARSKEMAQSSNTLAIRLAELQQAKDQGLVTQEEFSTCRQAIMDTFVKT